MCSPAFILSCVHVHCWGSPSLGAGIADPAESFPLLPSLYIILLTLKKYRGITLSQVLKPLERSLDATIRRIVECDFREEQHGLMKERGTTHGMYVLRQMVEKRLEVQGSMALGFVDLEKAFDTVPREMAMATLRWMGVPEGEVRMVEVMYEKTTARVLVGEGASGKCDVTIGLRQGNVLSPLLFIAVLYITSRKTMAKDAMQTLCRRPGPAWWANGKQEYT